MQLKNTVFLAFVGLLKVITETYLPQFPISAELVNVLLLAILARVGVDVVEFSAAKTRFATNFKA